MFQIIPINLNCSSVPILGAFPPREDLCPVMGTAAEKVAKNMYYYGHTGERIVLVTWALRVMV